MTLENWKINPRKEKRKLDKRAISEENICNMEMEVEMDKIERMKITPDMVKLIWSHLKNYIKSPLSHIFFLKFSRCRGWLSESTARERIRWEWKRDWEKFTVSNFRSENFPRVHFFFWVSSTEVDGTKSLIKVKNNRTSENKYHKSLSLSQATENPTIPWKSLIFIIYTSDFHVSRENCDNNIDGNSENQILMIKLSVKNLWMKQ